MSVRNHEGQEMHAITVGVTQSASTDLYDDFVWQRVVEFDLSELEVGIDRVEQEGFGLESHVGQ